LPRQREALWRAAEWEAQEHAEERTRVRRIGEHESFGLCGRSAVVRHVIVGAEVCQIEAKRLTENDRRAVGKHDLCLFVVRGEARIRAVECARWRFAG